MNNYLLRDIHRYIYCMKDVFEKIFYIARNIGICECKVIEFGLCLDESGHEQGYVKVMIAGEDEPLLIMDGIGYGAFPFSVELYSSWEDCVKMRGNRIVFDFNGSHWDGEKDCYDFVQILKKDGYSIGSSTINQGRIVCYKVGQRFTISTSNSRYSVKVDKDGLHYEVVPAEGYCNTEDEAIEASRPPLVTFRSA